MARKQRTDPRFPLKKNAPSFVYEILTGETKSLAGRDANHQQKMWRGIAVDAHIPTPALDGLNRIVEIEMRASCEGSGPERPTFIIFRFRTPITPDEINRFVKGINSFDDIYCGADIGNLGAFRVGVTTPLWYQKDPGQFNQWWLTLPTKINIVLAVIQTLDNA